MLLPNMKPFVIRRGNYFLLTFSSNLSTLFFQLSIYLEKPIKKRITPTHIKINKNISKNGERLLSIICLMRYAPKPMIIPNISIHRFLYNIFHFLYLSQNFTKSEMLPP